MVNIAPASWPERRGTWRSVRRGKVVTAHVSCPRCGRSHGLIFHHIAEDGEVTPSLTCANPACDFQEQIRLENWGPASAPTPVAPPPHRCWP